METVCGRKKTSASAKSKRQKQKQTLLQFNYECFKERPIQNNPHTDRHTHAAHNRLMQHSAKQNGTKVKIKT